MNRALPWAGGVRLEAGDWEALVLPGFGANLIRLSKGGQELLRTPESLGQLQADPFLYGSPLLLPPNRTRDGAFLFDGREYRLPISEPQTHCQLHGQFAAAPFTLAFHSQSRCVSRLMNPAEGPGSRFPFPFLLEIEHRLDRQGLSQSTRITNMGTQDMPLLLGFHLTFTKPESFAVPLGRRWERDARFLPTGRLLPLSEHETAWTKGASPGTPITGYFTAAGHTARLGRFYLHTSDNYTQWVLFGGGERNFLCIEPQSGPVNGLNLAGGAARLRPGETVRFCWRITVRPIGGNGQCMN